jgi:hypothetical protein
MASAYRVFETISEQPGSVVVVSTRGLRRIVIQPTGKVARELVPLELAKVFCQAYNGGKRRNRKRKTWAVMQSYPEIERSQAS